MDDLKSLHCSENMQKLTLTGGKCLIFPYVSVIGKAYGLQISQIPGEYYF
jgi:hypothetical protein